MARARNIKPSFFKNELLGQEDPLLGLLFISLWTLADKSGRLEDRPLRIKAETFPYRENVNINGYLTKLLALGFIERYKAGSMSVIEIVNFTKHQTPHSTEKASELPPKPIDEPITLINESASVNGHTNVLIPDSLLLIPDTGIKANAAGDAGQLSCPTEKIVEAYHRFMSDNPRCKVLNPARRSAIKARWIEASKLQCDPFGYSTQADGLNSWESFFKVCAESDFLTGKSKPQNGYAVFFADIDFLFSPSGFAKCLENKYHRGAE